jgi:hypothetical protein
MCVLAVLLLVFAPDIGLLERADAQPISGDAVKLCKKLASVFAKPIAERRISAEELRVALESVGSGSDDRKMCAALLLGFASDNKSREVLKRLRKAESTLIAGAASFALVQRAWAGEGRVELLGYLAYRLGRASNPFERLFLANRLFVDVGKDALPVILAAAKDEQNAVVRCDMLYYIRTLSDEESFERVRKWEWQKDSAVPENLIFVMASLTPGRSFDRMMNSCWILLKSRKNGR